jgi:sphingomyelin phosphodiesterase 2
MTIIRDHAGLTDAWFASHPDLVHDPPSSTPDAAAALSLFGVTADSPLNSYSAGKWLDEHARQFAGKRLDYVLYRQPARLRDTAPELCCTQCAVVFTEKVPRRNFSYSDHFGLEATFELKTLNRNVDATGLETSSSPFADEADVDAVSLATVPGDAVLPPSVLTHASISTVVGALTTCYRLSLERSKKYLYIFAGIIGFLLLIIVGSAWVPRSWANPILVLATVALSWLGTTMLYVGFIYGRWEVNALLNVIEELEIHQGTVGR